MADAGVPLGQALRDLAEQAGGGGLPPILRQVAVAVDGGETFSAALARFPKAFDATFVNLMKAGEAGGHLPAMLERTAARLETDLETRRKLLGAMIYPIAMLALCLGSVGFLLAFVFPKILPLFEGKGIELPGPTRLLMAVHGSLTDHWPYHLAAVAAAAGGFVWARRSPAGRAAWDRAVLELPIVGPLARKVSLSRSLRTLAATTVAGVPMLDGLKLAGAVAGNATYAAAWRVGAERVAGGTPLNAALAGAGPDGLFPPSVLQMLASGERTGKLGVVLDKVGTHYRQGSCRRVGVHDADGRAADDRRHGRPHRDDCARHAAADLQTQQRCRGEHRLAAPRREPRRVTCSLASGPASAIDVESLGLRLGLSIT